MGGPVLQSAIDGVFISIMDKLLALEKGQDILLRAVHTKLDVLEGDLACIHHTQKLQQQQHGQGQEQTQKQHCCLLRANGIHVVPSTELCGNRPDPEGLADDALDNCFVGLEPKAQVLKNSRNTTPSRLGSRGVCEGHTGTDSEAAAIHFPERTITPHAIVSRQTSHSKRELEAMITFATRQQEELCQQQEDQRGSACLRFLCPNVSKSYLEHIVDSVAGLMIILNSIMLGFAVDRPDAGEGAWFVVKCAFSAIFCLEIILKISVFGWRSQYRGGNAVSNAFDSLLVLADLVDIVLTVCKLQIPNDNPILILRTLRLMRVARIFRIFKARVFHDLLSMAHALMSGSSTLLWSIVFFLCFIYVASLLTRAIFGPSAEDDAAVADPESMRFYFRSLPRSVLTTYRCSFGDCTTQLGTPLLESTEEEHGLVVRLSLSALIFIASVAFFNIFAALFVERIMAFAANKNLVRQRRKLNDKDLWHDKMSKFIDLQLQLHEQVGYSDSGEIEHETLKMYRHAGGYKWLTKISEESLLTSRFSKEVLDVSVETNWEAQQILDDLDIEPQDCLKLSETLDRDKNGYIDVLELIAGLSGLRGPARRSDIVAVDLAVRSMQGRLDEIWLRIKEEERFKTV